VIQSQSGTIGGTPPAFVSGWARLTTAQAGISAQLLLLFSSRPALDCPIANGFELRPGEASVDLILYGPADGGAVTTGTFPIVSQSAMTGFVGSGYRAPSTCPADLGDGIRFASGSVTISSLDGRATGTFTGQLQGGEQVNASFALPFCPIRGIGGRCTP